MQDGVGLLAVGVEERRDRGFGRLRVVVSSCPLHWAHTANTDGIRKRTAAVGLFTKEVETES